MRGSSGQMSVELAVVLPVVIVMGFLVWNLGRFISACTLFDRSARDIVLAQGVAPSGEQTQLRRVDEVQSALQCVFTDWKSCEVSVSADYDEGDASDAVLSLNPHYVYFHCTLSYHPWPSALSIAGVSLQTPVVLDHSVEVVTGYVRPGVVR